jgi:hypothetical protein
MKRTVQVISLFIATSSVLAQGTIVGPNANANVEGNSSTRDPFTSSSFRFQQVFSASQFGLAPFMINSIAFRIDGASSGDVLYAFTGSTIQFSTTTRTPDNLSPVFADNIGSDMTTVRNGGIAFGGTYQPGANPQPFGQSSSVVPFFYNPAQGNLLLDIYGAGGITLFPGALDAHLVSGDSVSRVFAASDLASSGVADSLGFVTRFGVTAVPEPSTWALLILGFAMLLRRRRTR